MNLLHTLVLLSATGILMGLSGYAVVGWFRSVTASTRILAAAPLGMSLLLWSASTINLLVPLSGPFPYLALWPLAVVMGCGSVRRQLLADFATATCDGRARAIFMGAAVVVALFLYPLYRYPDIVFFDGTGNHDNYFWIVGADFLQRNTYLAQVESHEQPVIFMHIGAILGLTPSWGRMGAEGYVATLSGILQVAPIKAYVGLVTALLLPWLSAVFGLARAIGWPLRSRVLLGAAAVLQPLFLFFVTNGNLPNLCGAIAGGALLIATHDATGRDSRQRLFGLVQIPWLLHAMLVSYPEIAPFAGLPAATLVVIRWLHLPPDLSRSRLVLTIFGAVLAGLLINPITTWRAFHGFIASFASARADGGWPNIFDGVAPLSHLPASLTLITEAAGRWSPVTGAVATLAVCVGLGLALRGARCRHLLLASLAGFLALAGYTIANDFSYGWQKSAQFAAIPLAALYPLGVLLAGQPGRRRGVLLLALQLGACLPAVHGLWAMSRAAHRFAKEKSITSSMLEAKADDRAGTQGTILVHQETFRMPYFHGMWALYLLPEHHVFFPPGTPNAGGYLQHRAKFFDITSSPRVAAHYIGREWADAYHTTLPRLQEDRVHALLPVINDVSPPQGVYPPHDTPGARGAPIRASTHFSQSFNPHNDAELHIDLQPILPGIAWSGDVTCEVAAPTSAPRLWRTTVRSNHDGSVEIHVPLAGGRTNRVDVHLRPEGKEAVTDPLPFAVRAIEVRSTGDAR